MSGYPVKFVGAGPGDPDLITVKGKKALENADIVIYAGSLVPRELLKWTKKICESFDSASIHLDEFMEIMIKGYRAGKRVVRLHTGDPSLYGAISEQITILRREKIPFKVIPGVTAAFAAAAVMGIEYTLPEITQTLILTRMAGRTPVPPDEDLHGLASHKASMAVYLSITMIDRVAEILEKAYGPDSPAAVAYCVTQPGEKIIYCTVKDLTKVVKQEKIKKQALIIVGRAIDPDSQKKAEKSKLYDKSYTHRFRKGQNR